MHTQAADCHENLVFAASAADCNPQCAAAGRVTVVEAEEIVEPGVIAPHQVHLPGAFVQRVVHVPALVNTSAPISGPRRDPRGCAWRNSLQTSAWNS
ncbi:CoA-transferase [Streptomyces sp. HGB0020]|uniref:CoA-transferase n=1 Tax=Streptomyces sp. HGB0020 TaxID=1078086 RepID=UPI00034E5060|nr:CoA-transferase [Streptomyces sp. HGB0020]EPD57776.1 hypothetical protein HMPREF1211_06114 [Streptomyces sp. HGB0020]